MPAFEQRLPRVYSKASAVGTGVTLVAVVGEDGADAGFEELVHGRLLGHEGTKADENNYKRVGGLHEEGST